MYKVANIVITLTGKQPIMLTDWKESLTVISLLFGIIAALSGWIGIFVGKRKKEREQIDSVCSAIDSLKRSLDLVQHQNDSRAVIAIANLRLVFALGEELVNQGANGNLKKAVTDLRDLVTEESIPHHRRSTD